MLKSNNAFIVNIFFPIKDAIGDILWQIYTFLLKLISGVEDLVMFVAGVKKINDINFVDQIIGDKDFEVLFQKIQLLAIIILFVILVFMIMKNAFAKNKTEKTKEGLKNGLKGVVIILLIEHIFRISFMLLNIAVTILNLIVVSTNGETVTFTDQLFYNSLEHLPQDQLSIIKDVNGKDKLYLYDANQIRKFQIGKRSKKEKEIAIAEIEKEYNEAKENIKNDDSIEEEKRNNITKEMDEEKNELIKTIQKNVVVKMDINLGGHIDYIGGIITISIATYFLLKMFFKLIERVYTLIVHYTFSPLFAAYSPFDDAVAFDRLKKDFFIRLVEILVFIFLFTLLMSTYSISNTILKKLNLGLLMTFGLRLGTIFGLFYSFSKLQNNILSYLGASSSTKNTNGSSILKTAASATVAGQAFNVANNTINGNATNQSPFSNLNNQLNGNDKNKGAFVGLANKFQKMRGMNS